MANKIGTVVTKYLKLKTKIAEENKKVTDLKSQASELEKEIIKMLEAEKQTGTKVALGSVNISETVMGNIAAKDKPKLLKYAQDKDAMQLLDLRLSQGAYREMIEAGTKFTFIKPFTKKSLTKGVKR